MRLYSSIEELTSDLNKSLLSTFNLQGYRVFLCDEDENSLNLISSSKSTSDNRVLRSQVDPYIRSDFSFENESLFSDFTSAYCFPLISDEEFTGYLFISVNPDQPSLSKDALNKIYAFKDELGTLLDHLRLKLRLQRAETQELLGSISHGLAHDLISFLTPVQTYFQLLEDDPKIALNLSKAAASNVYDLLTFIKNARIYSERGRLIKFPCFLGLILDHAIKPCESLLQSNQVEVVKEFDDDATLEANSFLFQRLFTNLIRNAVDSGSTRIVVSLSREDGENGESDAYQIIRISDDGEGIDAENLCKIFNTGFSTKSSSGLGLAIAQKIASAHSGRIEAHSNNGQGAIMEIILPLKQTTAPFKITDHV